MAAGLPNVAPGFLVWGDYDDDGFLDVLICGNSDSGFVAQIWHNNGDGTFSSNSVAGLPALSSAIIAWGDYDNDGWPDILLVGTINGLNSGYITQLWHNNQDQTFSNVSVGLPDLQLSSAAWADYDNDGRLDVLYLGETPSAVRTTQLWRNQMLQTNTAPGTPTGLYVQQSGSDVVFHWNPASDTQTPASGLTYNLRVGTTPDASDIVVPLTTTDGFLKLPRSGQFNANFGRVVFPNTGTYYWSVQAVDSSFAASSFAPISSFTLIPALAPNPVPGDINGDGVVDESELAAILAHLGTNGTVSPANLNLALQNYLGTYPLMMSNVDGLGSPNILFNLPGFPNANLSVQSSTDLVNWQTLGPVNYGFVDTNAATDLQRFYRLSYP